MAALGWPKVSEFRTAMDAAETALDLDRGWFTDADALSPCPCFHLELDGLEIDGNCWRPHDHELDPATEGRCCLHLRRGRLDDARQLRGLLNAMDWYGDWTLIDERGPEAVIVPLHAVPDMSTLDPIRSKHFATTRPKRPSWLICDHDSMTWPCDTAKVLTFLDDYRAAKPDEPMTSITLPAS